MVRVSDETKIDIELEAMLRERLCLDGLTDMWARGMHVYLACNERQDFVVDLDVVWEAIGYSSKKKAKDLMVKHGVDLVTNRVSDGSGRLMETVAMTVYGFKKMCMVANTENGMRALQYYLAMEEAMREHTAEAMVRKDKALQEQTARAEKALAALEEVRGKKYEEVPRLEYVYICKEKAQDGTNVHKIGRTSDVNRRERGLRTGSAHGCFIIYQRATHNGALVESFLKNSLKRYHVTGYGGGVEHYDCDVGHTMNMLDSACVFMDTCASCRMYIEFQDMWGRINARVAEERGLVDGGLSNEPRYVVPVEDEALEEEEEEAETHVKVRRPTKEQQEFACKQVRDAVALVPITEEVDWDAQRLMVPRAFLRGDDLDRIKRGREILEKLGVFISERCVLAKTATTPSMQMLMAFNAYACDGDTGVYWGTKDLAKAMRSRGFEKKLARHAGVVGQCYMGVRLAVAGV
jgi:hypothetical protein